VLLALDLALGFFLVLCWGGEVFFDKFEIEREKRRRRCLCAWPLLAGDEMDPLSMFFGEYTASVLLAGVRVALSICVVTKSRSDFQLESLILAQNERWRQA
jgi:hypothetical protein